MEQDRVQIPFSPLWANMFPMPMTPFERYLVADDRPACPMTVVMYFIFRGSIQRASLEEAFRQAVAYEPAFWTRAACRKGKHSLELDLKNPPRLHFRTLQRNPSETREGRFTLPNMDTRENPWVTFWVEEAPEEVRITCLMHHLAGDGRGTMDFMGLWLAAYERLINPHSELELCPPDPELFARREELHIELPGKLSLGTLIYVSIKEAMKWFYRRPWVLRGDEPADHSSPEEGNFSPAPVHPEMLPPEAGGPVIHWQVLDNRLKERYLAAAKKHGVAVNSLFMRDLYLTLKYWREHLLEKKLTPPRRNAWLRVLMPGDLRNAHHEEMPCTNLIGYTFFDYLPEECGRDEAFLRKIQDISTLSQKWSGGAMFLNGLRTFCKIPGALAWVTSEKRCHSTSILSNLGVCCRYLRNPYFREIRNLRVTGLEMIRCQGMPPIRENTPVSVGVVTHAEDMVLSVAVDHRVFSDDAAKRFIEAYFRQLRETVGDAKNT